MSIRSESSATCSNSSHWSTALPLTPNYFPDPNEIPLPLPTRSAGGKYAGEEEEAGRMEVMVSEVGVDVDATPKRARRPHTPTPAPVPAPIDSSSSPSPYDVSTPSPSPSPSIQHYSSVLRETMRKHYDEAYKRMTTSGGKGMMAVDLSWDDEDPIDRHVRMAAYKQQAEAKRQAAAAEAARASLPQMDTDPMLGKPGPSSSRLDHGLPPARPTLLDFRGFSHLSDRSASAANDDTPGSIASEASFEAGSTEDWADMYGAMTPGVASVNTGNADRSRSSDLIATRMSLASISTDSTITSQSTASVPAPMPLPHAQNHDQNLGYAQPAAAGTFQPLPTPLPCSALASGYFAIPTQTVPAPISRPYGKRPTIGTRQRSRNHPYAHAVERQKELSSQSQSQSREEVPPVPTPSPGVEELYPERSESEMMVLRAGLRSQRTRVGSRL